MQNINKISLIIYRVIYIKNVNLVENILIYLFYKSNNSILHGLLSGIDYLRLNNEYKNKK